MRKAFKFRLYPTSHQIRELSLMLETHRRLYNACLAQKKDAYQDDGVSVTYCQQSAWFKNQRYVNKWYANLNFSSAQATMRRLDRAFAAFFRRIKEGQPKPGYPRFKAQGRFESIEFPAYGDGIKLLSTGKLRVQYVGAMRLKRHRDIAGEIKTVSLKMEADKWYAVFSCDLGEVQVPANENPAVGIDVGIESFLTTSDGEHVSNPKYMRSELPALRRAGRSVSRKKRGGKNRKKAVQRLRKCHAKVCNLRHDHRHKTSVNLCRRYGLIAVEDLNIRGMLKNRRLSRAIADAAWGGFIATLKHKAESAGVSVVEVSARGTSQECSRCGAVVLKKLSERVHRCPHCGLVLHRDINAARVILARALARTEPAGANGHRTAVA